MKKTMTNQSRKPNETTEQYLNRVTMAYVDRRLARFTELPLKNCHDDGGFENHER